MIKVSLTAQCGDDINQLLHLLSKGIELVQSSYMDGDHQIDVEVIEKTGILSVTLLSDRREKFNDIEINCCG
jgi:hypothetical protein